MSASTEGFAMHLRANDEDERGLVARLDESDAVAEWLAAAGHARITGDAVEDGLALTELAAYVHSRQNRWLAAASIERNLQVAARHVGDPPRDDPRPGAARRQRPAMLHVLSEALPAGGHTAMAVRWMRADGTRAHGLALLDQQVPIPGSLRRAAVDDDVTLHLPPAGAGLVAKAAWLRALAHGGYDHVVLHVGVSDVISGTAFGLDGGPPVLQVNHAAHAFWTGATVADAVLNCRGSQLEDRWTRAHRGAQRSLCVPIPLEPAGCGPRPARDDRAALRDRHRLPRDAVVALTVGAYFKFLPSGGHDFLATVERVLQHDDRLVVVAVGFAGDERWRRAADRHAGRVRTLGVRSSEELAEIRLLADLYVEGFPFGTTTSLLEAGMAGLPAVLAPATCPPPYGTDGLAVDRVLYRPKSVDAYAREVLRLARSPGARIRLGEQLQHAVRTVHSGHGWHRHLDESLREVGDRHRVAPPRPLPPTPIDVHRLWARFVERTATPYDQRLEQVLRRCWSLGLYPALDANLVRALRARRTRTGSRSASATLTRAVAALVPKVLSPRTGDRLLRLTDYARREGLTRVPRRLLGRRATGSDAGGEWYRDYRDATGAPAGAPPTVASHELAE